MPLMVTFFNVRKGRDAIFKRGMRHIFSDAKWKDAIAQTIVLDGSGVDTVVTQALGVTDPAMPDALVELAWSSPAPLAIVPMQDLLGLGNEARMNRPGIAEGNWRWRMTPDALAPDLARRLREALTRHSRLIP